MTHSEDILKKRDAILKSGCPDLKLQINTVGEIDLFNKEDWEKGAIFSRCRKYRFTLWRVWDKSKMAVMFIGLNPSTANENINDPTIRRVIQFAFDWGYGGVYMLNLFAYVTTDPKELKTPQDLLSDNDLWLINIGAKCDKIIFAWGSFKEARERGKEIMKTFNGYGYALAINRDGSPRHPLYVKKDVKLIKIEQ